MLINSKKFFEAIAEIRALNFIDNDQLTSLQKNKEKITKYFQIIKEPRWEDDALILKWSHCEPIVTIKIHQEKYPLASHIYNCKELIQKINKSNYLPTIVHTEVFTSNNKLYRLLAYEFIQGEPLGKLCNQKPDSISEFKSQLKNLVENLLQIGFNAFVRDLDDFLITKKGIKLTDLNALIDVSNSSNESRSGVKEIIFNVIDKIVVKEYKRFSGTRPTMR